ncbi:wax ester/triacylglycerol synthase family O-acyltransferase [Mycobacterium sp. NPDC048908]|uniref:WS/DGAT/MGAT family O-acyltransferase n=1 Tax=Mycobacterium sp. NPDC048908 TaxID=3364292 RepID=UPI003721CC73
MKRLSGWDALLLYSETPNVHQHTLKVAVVDISHFQGEPTFEVFRETLRRRLPLLEPLRYQLAGFPLQRPVWREDAHADLDYHVRPVTVPAPGGRRELDEVIGAIASTPLDRSRPLWEIYYAQGLADHRVAVIGKVHHALADGVASANLMARGMEWPDRPVDESDTDSRRTPTPSATELIGAAGRHDLRRLRKLPGVVRDGVLGIYRLRRRAHGRGRDPDLARQFHPPPTFLNHKLSPARTFATATLSLAEVKQTSKHLDVTINDLVLAMATGGLRELLLRYDGHAEQPIIANIPAATDTSPDRITGNALSTMLVSLPVHVANPLEWVRLTSAGTRVAKENYELLGPRTIGRWLEYLPAVAARATFRWTSRREAANPLFNVIVSNVPGPRRRGHITGAVVTEIYSVGPLAAGSALNITVWSYVDQLNISVLADGRTLDDPHNVTDAMIRAFIEIRRGAGFADAHSRIDSAMPQATPG